MLWDLRMRSGSRVRVLFLGRRSRQLTHVTKTLDHKPGVLSLSWCKWDKDLLLSCNKFGGTRCWNIQTSKVALEVCILSIFACLDGCLRCFYLMNTFWVCCYSCSLTIMRRSKSNGVLAILTSSLRLSARAVLTSTSFNTREPRML